MAVGKAGRKPARMEAGSAAQVRECMTEVIELADQDLLDLMRPPRYWNRRFSTCSMNPTTR